MLVIIVSACATSICRRPSRRICECHNARRRARISLHLATFFVFHHNPRIGPKFHGTFQELNDRLLPLDLQGEWRKQPNRSLVMAIWRVGRAHDNLDRMFEDAAPVDVALAPSVEEFAERYVRHERPVIVRGGVKDWPPSYKWTPEYLKAMYGTRG